VTGRDLADRSPAADPAGGRDAARRTARRQRSEERRRRDREIVDALVAGEPLVDIATGQGVSSLGAGLTMVNRAVLERLPLLEPALVARTAAARLDRLLHVWWPRALDGDPDATLVVIELTRARVAVAGAAGVADTTA
jgi:hypothetical protein